MMDRADYDAKVGQMLNDANTYQLLKRDPTASLEWKMNSQLLHLVRVCRLHNDSSYCSVCVSIHVVRYFTALLIIFIHSITTVTFPYMSTPVTTLYFYSLSILYIQLFTDEGCCIVTEMSELL